MEFEKKVGIKHIKTYLPRAHIEGRKGTAEQAITYCKKDGAWIERGEPSKQGERTDLERAREDAVGGAPIRTVLGYGNFQTVRFTELYLKYLEPARTERATVEFVKEIPESKGDIYWKDEGQWWEGYDAHEIVVLRYSGRAMQRLLLDLSSARPMRVMNKGGSRQMRAKKIYVLTEMSEEEWWGVGLE